LGGPDWLVRRRGRAFEEFTAMPLPSEKEEIWRYTPIDQLDLDAYAPLEGNRGTSGPVAAVWEQFARVVAPSAAVVATRNGTPVRVERSALPPGVAVGGLSSVEAGEDTLGAVVGGASDALVHLNDAFLSDPVVVTVPPGVVVEHPVVVVHYCDAEQGAGGRAPACFPRTRVHVGSGGQASVVEVVTGPPGASAALVVPVTELSVDDGGHLSYASLQILGSGAWHIARVAATAARDARLETFGAGLGGAYDRARTDCALTGAGGSSQLLSVYLGAGQQVHDIRTQQDHQAPHTSSDLLCKGAVAGSARSVYSGLIRVRHGAVRTQAMQTNHNLVLDHRAHADSVPNLNIEENDVRCSHASTVGPVDEDQLYYLQSRGVPPERAEELIVLGFFDDIVERSPVPAITGVLRAEVRRRLSGALGIAGLTTGRGPVTSTGSSDG